MFDKRSFEKVIIFLCTKEELHRERKGYADAFKRLGYTVICSGNIKRVKPLLEGIENRVLAIIQPEGYTPIHPFDIQEVNYPTIIFQWDTYTRSKIRARASLPYDVKIVCHPDFDNFFTKKGCSHTYVLPWCVDDMEADILEGSSKKYEVGWVGRFDTKFYSFRRKTLKHLQNAGFVMNDPNRNYSWGEMFQIYKNSKIVVNISRDDFLQDANMRCFEAMGAGALLFTRLPTELVTIGFVDGEDFIGFTELKSLNEVIRYYLSNEDKRIRISQNGKKKVLQSHTYYKRAETLIKIITDKREVIMSDNLSRKLLGNKKMQQLAYTFWKDGELQKMFDCLMLSKTRVPFGLLMCIFKLFLVKLKRVVFN